MRLVQLPQVLDEVFLLRHGRYEAVLVVVDPHELEGIHPQPAQDEGVGVEPPVVVEVLHGRMFVQLDSMEPDHVAKPQGESLVPPGYLLQVQEPWDLQVHFVETDVGLGHLADHVELSSPEVLMEDKHRILELIVEVEIKKLEGPQKVLELLRICTAQIDDGSIRRGALLPLHMVPWVVRRAELPFACLVVHPVAVRVELLPEIDVGLGVVGILVQLLGSLVKLLHEGPLQVLRRLELPLVDVFLEV
mmetsp:Transcript_34891/g.109089  ORF Transcript_34891/g.109089 Transcript_34891/m.109089 type:complete len:247 (-) Transcript_34891:199-939(-)